MCWEECATLGDPLVVRDISGVMTLDDIIIISQELRNSSKKNKVFKIIFSLQWVQKNLTVNMNCNISVFQVELRNCRIHRRQTRCFFGVYRGVKTENVTISLVKVNGKLYQIESIFCGETQDPIQVHLILNIVNSSNSKSPKIYKSWFKLGFSPEYWRIIFGSFKPNSGMVNLSTTKQVVVPLVTVIGQ